LPLVRNARASRMAAATFGATSKSATGAAGGASSWRVTEPVAMLPGAFASGAAASESASGDDPCAQAAHNKAAVLAASTGLIGQRLIREAT
jgi:hypothetical protein